MSPSQSGTGYPTEIIRPASPAEETTPNEHPELRSRKERPAPQPKVKRRRPADKPIPHRIDKLLLYGLNCLFGRPDVVPKPSAKQAAVLEIKFLEDKIRYMARHMQVTVAFVNVKGGASKTTTATYVGCILSELTRKNIFLLPATQATATSTTAMNSGVSPEDTLTIGEFARNSGRYKSYRELSDSVPRNAFGLAVISEDLDTDVSIDKTFGLEQFCDVVDTLRPSTDVMLFDTGNDEIRVGGVVLEAVRRADVVVFTATADKPVTLEKLTSTMGLYMTDLRNERNRDRGATPRAEDQIPTYDKVTNSLVVVSGTSRTAKPGAYEKFTAHRDRKGNIKSTIGFSGKILTIPRDQYMASHIVADVKKINQRYTYLAYLRLIDSIYTNAMQQRGVSYQFTPGDD